MLKDLAETPDGFLWITSRDGLFRFDGRSFELMDGHIDRTKYGTPVELLAAADGGIRIWYPKGWLAEYRDGRLSFVRAPDTGGEVATLNQTRDGTIWVGIAQIGTPFLRYRRGRWERVAPNPDRDMLVDALITADGAFWLTYTRSIFRRPPNGTRFERVDIPVTQSNFLTTDATGAIWIVGTRGGRRITGPNGRWPDTPSRWLQWRTPRQRWLNAALDRQGNLWTMGDQFGRVAGLVQAEHGGSGKLAYELGDVPQMTSKTPASLLVDRRGNIWYGGPRSLDRFNVPAVVREPGLTNTATYGDVLYTSSSGAVFIGQSDAIYRVDPGGSPIRLFGTTTAAEAICEDRESAIWIALGDRIERLRGGKRTSFPRPPAETGIYECGEDPSGRFWLTASTTGMYWRDGARWQPVGPTKPSGALDATQRWLDPQRRLWFLTAPNLLTRVDGGFAEQRSVADRPDYGDIVSLLSASNGLLISRREGASFRSATGVSHLIDQQTRSLRNATGLVQTGQGDTWIYGPAGLVRMRTADLEKAFSNPAFRIKERVFGYEDGVLNQPNAQAWRSMVAGGDGRLWLATLDGIEWLDPRRLPFNPTPPGVVIASLTAGGAMIKDPSKVTLQAGSSDVTIAFAALSLAMPERVKVLYRLEGQDRAWVDPGARRQAFYTNLAPGTYRFRVIAANEDGVWNQVGDALEFSLPPTFVQSFAFKLLCALALAALAWLAYSIRLRVVAGRIRMRMAERFGERERIARELHDTLLQAVQSLTLRFQLALDEMPGQTRAKLALERAIDDADAVIAEGRDRVLDLRPGAQKATPQQVILDIVDRQAFDGNVEVHVDVTGTPVPLDPFVLDEVTRISSEAIFNIWRHAHARHVAIEIGYHDPFRLRFADDGIGIDPQVSAAGHKPGHFGLLGMRERAQKLKATLTVRRRPEGGSEVILTVPGAVAYQARRWRMRNLLGRSRATPP